jgi:hypothetical protein
MNSEHQQELLHALATKFAEDGSYRTLIVDSLSECACRSIDWSDAEQLPCSELTSAVEANCPRGSRSDLYRQRDAP